MSPPPCAWLQHPCGHFTRKTQHTNANNLTLTQKPDQQCRICLLTKPTHKSTCDKHTHVLYERVCGSLYPEPRPPWRNSKNRNSNLHFIFPRRETLPFKCLLCSVFAHPPQRPLNLFFWLFLFVSFSFFSPIFKKLLPSSSLCCRCQHVAIEWFGENFL